MKKWLKRLLAALFGSNITVMPVTPTPVAVALWPHYYAGNYFQHGNPNEDAYRQNAINECRLAGKNTLYVVAGPCPDPELSMHLLNFESDKVPGYFLDHSWYRKAKAQGVPRTIIKLSEISNWPDRLKAYTRDELQIAVSKDLEIEAKKAFPKVDVCVV